MLRSKSRRKTGPSEATQRLIWDRADYACERCGKHAPNHGGQIHHRNPRKMGGTVRPEANAPNNLVLLCAGCHADVESNRAQARKDGWLLQDYQPPEVFPLTRIDGRQFLLVGEGRIWL